MFQQAVYLHQRCHTVLLKAQNIFFIHFKDIEITKQGQIGTQP